MRTLLWSFCLLSLLVARIAAAQNSGLTARELYYQAVADDAPARGAKTTSTDGGTGKVRVPATPSRFGVRYNLLKINPDTNLSQSVDPDTVFAAGDCLALRLTTNRTARLFIFNRGASGAWQPLLPGPERPDERVSVSAAGSIQAPEGACFRIDPPSGTEQLLLLFTERDENFEQLNREMQNLIPPTSGKTHVGPGPEPKPADPVQLADTTEQEVAKLMQRDLRIEKISEASADGELPDSVYAVKKVASKQDRLGILIRIRHE